MSVGSQETGTSSGELGDGESRRPPARASTPASRRPRAPLAATLEAGWAPRAGAFLEVQAWEHVGPGDHRQEPQVAPAGQYLQSVDQVARQHPSAVQRAALVAPKG